MNSNLLMATVALAYFTVWAFGIHFLIQFQIS
jgi:hypothetical protein